MRARGQDIKVIRLDPSNDGSVFVRFMGGAAMSTGYILLDEIEQADPATQALIDEYRARTFGDPIPDPPEVLAESELDSAALSMAGVRNVAILGHPGGGSTTLEEGMIDATERVVIDDLSSLAQRTLDVAIEGVVDESVVCKCSPDEKRSAGNGVVDPILGMYVCAGCRKPSALALEKAAARDGGIVW